MEKMLIGSDRPRRSPGKGLGIQRIGIVIATLLALPFAALADPLPSWNDTAAKARILSFVASVTDPASPDFVPEPARVATFDNDGTLWSEQPLYFQLFFALDRLREMAAADPSVLSTPALKAAAAGDMAALAATGTAGLLEVVDATHAGTTVEAFTADVRNWMTDARHPNTGKRYDEMVFQPMLELLAYLRDEGFTTYIVSGGGLHFIRAFAQEAYNIPPEQVIGSTGKATYEVIDGVPTILKAPGVFFIDDKEGKPLAIDGRIGRRPILAAGNSDGDFEMLDWTTSGPGPRLGLLVHHTDAERELAYDRDSQMGRLARGLDEGPGKGWLIVDMAADWAKVYPH